MMVAPHLTNCCVLDEWANKTSPFILPSRDITMRSARMTRTHACARIITQHPMRLTCTTTTSCGSNVCALPLIIISSPSPLLALTSPHLTPPHPTPPHPFYLLTSHQLLHLLQRMLDVWDSTKYHHSLFASPSSLSLLLSSPLPSSPPPLFSYLIVVAKEGDLKDVIVRLKGDLDEEKRVHLQTKQQLIDLTQQFDDMVFILLLSPLLLPLFYPSSLSLLLILSPLHSCYHQVEWHEWSAEASNRTWEEDDGGAWSSLQ